MALATLAQCKAYLRKQTTAEDTLITALLASAIGRIEAYLRRPILTVSRAFEDEAESLNGLAVRSLVVPVTPCGTLASITDRDGTAVDVSTVRVGKETGLIRYTDGGCFDNGPYTITLQVGLALRSNYATIIEPAINQAIIDVVADLYQRRNPAAAQESAGGGVSVAYTQGDNGGLPDRIASTLKPFRMVGVS